MLLYLVGVKDEGLEGGERAHEALELRRLAFVLQIVAPHFIELAALRARVAEHLLARVGLAVGCEHKKDPGD